MHKRLGLLLAFLVMAFARPGLAAKPEDVFKGKIIITKNRMPMRFSSEGQFVAALQKNKIDKIWPTEEKGDSGNGASSTSRSSRRRSTTARSR